MKIAAFGKTMLNRYVMNAGLKVISQNKKYQMITKFQISKLKNRISDPNFLVNLEQMMVISSNQKQKNQ